MRTVFVFLRLTTAVCLTLALCACQKDTVGSEAPIPYPIPASSPFAKIQPGWPMKKVRDTIGNPTDTRTYTTGMASYVPFLSGDSDYRAEDFYKGQGRIVYAGNSDMGLQSYGVLRIIYDEEESGYADKVAYPDGPHNKPKPAPAPASRPAAKKRPARQASQGAGTPAAIPTPAKAAQPSAPGASPAPAPAPVPAPTTPPVANDDPLSGL